MKFQSGIYCGSMRHRRYSPSPRSFSYQLSMFGIDLDELDYVTQQHWLFGTHWYNPIRFCANDYLKNDLNSEPSSLNQRIINKVQELGGKWDGSKVIMLAQCRALGLYFSPVNFFYCYQQSGECNLMLAEVSNTPWNQRHYYLVNLNKNEPTDKAFHVSPFMTLDMYYKWQTSLPNKRAFVHIENYMSNTTGIEQTNKVFDATMALTKQPFSSLGLIKTWFSLPFSIIKLVWLIYWQALKIFLKGIKFVPYQKQ